MGWIEISVALMAVAFTVLVVYVIRTLILTQKALQQVTDQLVQIQSRIDQLSEESVQLIRQTNLIAEDFYKKIKAFDQMFSAIEDVGQSVKQVSGSVRQISASLSDTMTQSIEKKVIHSDDKIGEILKWATYSYELFMRWRSARSKQNHYEGGIKNG
jgi:uncharacterized protein YoxC